MLLGEQLQQPVLGAVGVLVLVDEHPAEGPPVAVADVLEQLEQVDGADQEVVEVHRVGLVHALLVQLVDVGDGLLEEGALRPRDRPRRRAGGSSRRRSAPWTARGGKRFGSTSAPPCSA